MSTAPPRQEFGALPAAYVLPESFRYRLKKKLLGVPLITERLSEERLGKVAALGVLAPDCISSTAYGTEEMLTQLVPYFGLAAFSLVLPITALVLVVLFFVTLSYREVVMVYTKAGGSYVVGRDNFGPRIAQIAAVALIIDYIVTVAVQTSAGTDALTSAFPSLSGYTVPITVGVVIVLTYGNLRGIREAGRTFALPTYLFIASIGSLVVIGLIRAVLGQLHVHSIHKAGVVQIGAHGSSSLLVAASVFIILKSFANGGSSLTGLEAISNGVANFREPTGRNARRVLVLMSCTLGSLVLGVSILAHITHAVPYTHGTPTVLSQEAHYVFGDAFTGRVGFFLVQATTMLILYTGANTSFNGFPNLTSFVAKDAFLPRQLTRRGHRLVFSNGIIILAIVSIALIIATRADLTSLVALYAIGVFTGFTMAGAGMVKHHVTFKEKGWKYKIWINGFAALLSAIVVLIFATTKFTQGAWLVVVLFPILVFVLIRLHKQYEDETEQLESNAERAAAAPVLRRHVVLVFVERLDLAAARALQYARTLAPDELRAVHFVLDTKVSSELEAQWSRLGLTRFPLEMVECPDRRLMRASMEAVAEAAADGQTEVSVLLPRRVFHSAWSRVLHDNTAESIAGYVSQLPHANATIIPFQLGKRRALVPWSPGIDEVAALVGGPGRTRSGAPAHPWGAVGANRGAGATGDGGGSGAAPEVSGSGKRSESGDAGHPHRRHGLAAGDRRPRGRTDAREDVPGATPIGELQTRQRGRVTGRVRSVKVQAGAGVPSVECALSDTTGQLMLVFQGRRHVPGIEPGARLVVEGMVGERGRHMVMINPLFTILSTPEHGGEGPAPTSSPPRR
ncbi:MAG: amino acid permease [Acidimicrobiales bacterium]